MLYATDSFVEAPRRTASSSARSRTSPRRSATTGASTAGTTAAWWGSVADVGAVEELYPRHAEKDAVIRVEVAQPAKDGVGNLAFIPPGSTGETFRPSVPPEETGAPHGKLRISAGWVKLFNGPDVRLTQPHQAAFVPGVEAPVVADLLGDVRPRREAVRAALPKLSGALSITEEMESGTSWTSPSMANPRSLPGWMVLRPPQYQLRSTRQWWWTTRPRRPSRGQSGRTDNHM